MHCIRKIQERRPKKVLLLILLILLNLCTIALLGSGIETARAETSWHPTKLMKPYISSLEITPIGLYAGELNTNYWELPYNGIYFSPNKEASWHERGLKGLGITDIKFSENTLYAATYYSTDKKQAGLYYSTDWGENWTHIGPNLSARNLAVFENRIFLGTYEDGLWLSKDKGDTWEKVDFGEDALYSPYSIEKIFVDEKIIIVKGLGLRNGVFSSKDKGETWQREEWLEYLRVNDFLVYSDLLYVATEYLGVVISKDFKTIYETVGRFYNEPVLSIYKNGTNIYVGVLREAARMLEIYKSADQGINWEDTKISEKVSANEIYGIKGIFGFPSSVFGLIPGYGIYTKDVVFSKAKEPFLGNLWKDQKPKDLLNKITSFFDHEYPFLGYSQYSEPREVAEKTVNFLGQEGKEPDLYYSSHDGYDFGLPYGTEILAPADGLVRGYYCISCGNTLGIDHPNGYKTIYMHLQKEDLIAESWEKDIPVKEGDVIGRVGMTGNTTGPHLHFQIYKPVYDGAFWEITHPKNLEDPFGWLNDFKYDPWAFFKWKDVYGEHSGRASKYLWKEDITLNDIKGSFNGQLLLMDLDNISLQIPGTTYAFPLAFQLAYITPPAPLDDQKYIDSTSLAIVALDATGKRISQLGSFITIKMTLTLESIQDVLWDTLALYHWNSASNLWEKLSSSFDPATLELEAQTNEISEFAVFGENTLTGYPQTLVSLSGHKVEHWFTEYPVVTLSNGGTGKILYSLYGEFWEEYSKPFYIEEEGIVRLRYRSIGENGVTEPLNIMWIRIDTQNKTKKTLFIEGTQLTIL